MSSCTCEEERESMLSANEILNDARASLQSAEALLGYLQAAEESLSDDLLDAACDIASKIPAGKITCAILQALWLIALAAVEAQKLVVDIKRSKFEEAKENFEKAFEEYKSCKNSLKPCAGPCGKEVKPECIKTCEGCGRDYCNDCFDAGIEAWELKQQ